MKTIKQIREEYDNKFLVQTAPDELMLEGRESAIKSSGKAVPSPANMPAMLLFRRVAYRSYPGHQTVALYYSKLVNKYLSVPFGPDGNLNLSEAVIVEGPMSVLKGIGGGISGGLQGAAKGFFKGAAVAAEPGAVIGGVVGGVKGAYKGAKRSYNKAKAKEQNMEEDWQDVNRKDKTDGLSQKAVNAYRREHPGSNLKTAVTEKNPTGKRASRRKSFCSRMGGMKKRLTSAKTARDPDSNINKALRRWNCEESFREKLAEKRQLRENPLISGALRYGPSIARAAGPTALKYGKNVLKYGKNIAGKGLRGLKNLMVPAAAGAAAGAAASKQSGSSPSDSIGSAFTTHKADLITAKKDPQMSSSYKMGKGTDQTFDSRYKQSLIAKPSQTNENKISDIRKMINENVDTMDLSINGRTVTLNNSMAKKIVRVYESVNTKNKKIVESMLNEDLDSFKKLLNFSIKA